jgi:hypothetical protein
MQQQAVYIAQPAPGAGVAVAAAQPGVGVTVHYGAVPHRPTQEEQMVSART